MQAKFEIRSSRKTVSGSDNIDNKPHTLSDSNSQPAFNWVEYTKQMFEGAKSRSNDTPDDLSTEKNEASKTGLQE